MRRIVLIMHLIIGVMLALMLGGILFVLSLRISGSTQMALLAWGILLGIIGAIVGALIGAKRRSKGE